MQLPSSRHLFFTVNNLSIFCSPIYLRSYLHTGLSISLSIHPSIHPSIDVSNHLSICILNPSSSYPNCWFPIVGTNAPQSFKNYRFSNVGTNASQSWRGAFPIGINAPQAWNYGFRVSGSAVSFQAVEPWVPSSRKCLLARMAFGRVETYVSQLGTGFISRNCDANAFGQNKAMIERICKENKGHFLCFAQWSGIQRMCLHKTIFIM